MHISSSVEARMYALQEAGYDRDGFCWGFVTELEVGSQSPRTRNCRPKEAELGAVSFLMRKWAFRAGRDRVVSIRRAWVGDIVERRMNLP
jgi:hypothetical protein